MLVLLLIDHYNRRGAVAEVTDHELTGWRIDRVVQIDERERDAGQAEALAGAHAPRASISGRVHGHRDHRDRLARVHASDVDRQAVCRM